MDWFGRILSAIAKAVAAYFLGRRAADQARDDARSGARAEGAAETQSIVAEVADAQVRVAVDGPDGADALAAELRARAARLAGGAGLGAGRR